MNILYLRTQYWIGIKIGGSVTHTSGVINGLINKDANVKVVTSDELPFVDKSHCICLKPSTYVWTKNYYLKEILYSIHVARNISRMVNLTDYSYIYHRYASVNISSILISNKEKTPVIIEYNSSDAWKLKNWKSDENMPYSLQLAKKLKNNILFLVLKFFEKRILNHSKLVVVVSEALKENLVRSGIKKEKIFVNPNGVDTKRYKPSEKDVNFLKQYHCENKVVVGFVGTFNHWHGVEVLAEAIISFYLNNNEYKKKVAFVFVGDGVLTERVKKTIRDNRLGNDTVVFTGPVPFEKMPQVLSIFDICLNATIKNPDNTKFFGSPTKLFEYMAMGKAIVSTRVGQMSEILMDSETALLVEPNDPEEIQRAISELVKDPDLRIRLGKNARNEVVQKYSWDKHAERLLWRLSEFNA